MGEEEKKPAGEEKKMEEKKPDKEEEAKKESSGEAKPEEKKGGEEKKESKEGKDSKEESPPPPPPPQEIVLRVYMHCEGCARKVRSCLKGFDGVEEVITDCKTSKVVVKGEKAAADPLKVVERVQRKSHRQVELISPIPKLPAAEEEKKADADQEKDKPKPEEKQEQPQVITVVLKVYMHCEACAMEIKKRILRMKGVESAEPDLKTSEVAVKGVFDPPKLVDYVYKKTGKQAVIVKQVPEKKEDDKGTEPSKEKKEEGGDKDKKGEGGDQQGDSTNKEKKLEGQVDDAQGGGGGDATGEEITTTVVEMKRNEYYYYPQRNLEMMYYAYPPQIFSDENPNACTVM